MLEPAGEGLPMPRALLRVGGVPLARHQLSLALAMDCQRVVCLARDLNRDLIALQHEAEARGAQFHVVRDTRALSGLVTANDEVLVQADGLFATAEQAAALLDGGPVVLVQPVEAGLAAGFERIDINRASAGAMRLPGRLIEGLAELPADCDPVSALTRIALQGGIALREVPADLRGSVDWRMIRDEPEAQAQEEALIRQRIGTDQTLTPGLFLARATAMTFGPSLLHAGSGARVARIAALAVLLLGIGSGWLGLTALGLLFGALAAVVRSGGILLGRVEQSLRGPHGARPLLREEMLGWAIDLELIVLMLWHSFAYPWESLQERAFAPVMLVLVTRLVPRVLNRAWADWFADRAVLGLGLAAAVIAGFLAEAVQLVTIFLMLAGIALHAGRARIT